MFARLLVVTMALSLGGCKKNPPSAAAKTEVDRAMDTLIGFRDRVCACTDTVCVDEAQRAMSTWLLAHGKELAAYKYTPAQDAAGQKASGELAACATKIQQAGRPK